MSIATSKNPNVALAIRFILLAIVVTGFLFLVSFLTGCTPIQAQTAPAAVEKAEEAPAAPVEPAQEEAPATDHMVAHFGETLEYSNGLAVTVGAPRVFEPTEWAAGVIKGQESLVFEVTLTNNTGEKIEPMAYSTVSSAGIEASLVFDTDNPELDAQGGLNGSPMTVILPGKSVTWLEGFSVADAGDLTYELSPGYEYENAIFIPAS